MPLSMTFTSETLDPENAKQVRDAYEAATAEDK